jgi:glutathione S-transferase
MQYWKRVLTLEQSERLPVLYSFRRCPYAMRARLALLVSRTDYEHREVILRDKPPELIALSPKATVPVLLTPDGLVVDQSIDIMYWALARHDPEDWMRTASDPLIAANDGQFKFHLDRYKYSHRHDSDPYEHRAAALSMLEILEARLMDSANLSGARRSLVDMAIMPFVRQFANTDRAFFDSIPLIKLKSWLAFHVGSPIFEAAMVQRSAWKNNLLPSPD